MVRLVLFDIDGTLISTGGAGEKAFARVFHTLFNVPNGTDGLQFAGRTDAAILREFFLRHRIEPSSENFLRFFDTYVFWLDHILRQLPGTVLPGALELISQIESLPQPPLIGLLTGNVRLGAQIKLTHYQLWNRFHLGAFADDHEDRCKIAEIARQRGSRILGQPLAGTEVLVIGDTPLDIACARSIDARVLAVATGRFTESQLLEHQPDWAVETLARACGSRLREMLS